MSKNAKSRFDKPYSHEKKQIVQRTYTKPAFELSAEQQKALRLMESGANMFLTGNAGTGKSAVINTFLYKHHRDKKIMICAPTGIAAINVQGATLHRMFDIPTTMLARGAYNKDPRKAIRKADVIIIDEISMCRIDVFEYVINTLYNNDLNPQIILVGDFFQLPPVVTSKDSKILEALYSTPQYGLSEGVPFTSVHWDELNLKYAYLKEVHRQSDPKFLTALNQIRCGDFAGLRWFTQRVQPKPKKSMCLCGTNKQAEDINDRELNRLNTPLYEFKAERTGRVSIADMNVPEILRIRNGARVVMTKNDMNDQYQNGSLGTILHILNDPADPIITVELDNGNTVMIHKNTTDILEYSLVGNELITESIGTFSQLPLKVAYAMTIHKAQGQTYDHVHVYPNCFAPGQLYVALSRATTPEGLTLESPCKDASLKTLPAVKKFDRYIAMNSII